MNFALILVVLSFVQWVYLSFSTSYSGQKNDTENQKPNRIIEYSRSFFPCVFLLS